MFDHGLKKIVVPQHVLVQTYESEAVLLNLETKHYYSLDDVGTRMWLVLTAGDNLQTAFQRLLSIYEVEPEILQRDLNDFLAKLQNLGLVELSGSETSESLTS